MFFHIKKMFATDDNRTQSQTATANSARPQNAMVFNPEKLTGAVVERLVGHANVVYYNFDTNVWNTTQYNGYTISNQHINTQNAKGFKAEMEKNSSFNKEYEFLAPVSMTIHSKYFAVSGKPVFNPQHSATGSAVVGNVIVRNKNTGRIELYCRSWIGVYAYYYPVGAADNGAGDFVRYGARNADFRQALHTAHTR